MDVYIRAMIPMPWSGKHERKREDILKLLNEGDKKAEG
jgi:hypothetical protein